ncbi:MAG: hypothetical protein RLZZ324_851 [Candidatus Parcubacteria bacterium]|jgi:uncharacterized membrane protein YphA (DoxX/SURF4 family)
MRRNLDVFERLVRLLLAIVLLYAGIALYVNPYVQFLAFAFALFCLWEIGTGHCSARAMLGGTAKDVPLKPATQYLMGLVGVQLVLAYVWMEAGWEKLSDEKFVGGIDGTLKFFASKNPFPWFVTLLRGPFTDHSLLFAYAVEWGEMAAGVALAVAAFGMLFAMDEKHRRLSYVLSKAALAGGMVMSASFYFAAGWTGPGTKSVNVLMFWTQAVLAYVWASSWIASRSGKWR